MESSGGEAASLREAPLPQPPSPEERLAFALGRFCLLGSACEVGAFLIGLVLVTGDEPLRPLRGHLPFQGRLFRSRSSKGSPRAKHVLPTPRLSSSKHRPIVENGTFSTGPFVRNRRDPRPGRPCEAPPTQAACMRGVRGPARRMETSPAPGSLWFLSPAGKELVRPQTHETPSSHTLNPARVPPSPHPIALPCSPFQLLAASIPSPQNHKKRETR